MITLAIGGGVILTIFSVLFYLEDRDDDDNLNNKI